jgi:hypothetical protein
MCLAHSTVWTPIIGAAIDRHDVVAVEPAAQVEHLE